jgi:arylsulfatase
MKSRAIVGHAVTAVLGILTVAVLAFLATAEGDEFIGVAPDPAQTVKEVMPEQPDIIIITVDTLRSDRLGAYGYEKAKTPHVDALGRGGVIFTEATVALPRTTPGLASLMTGLLPEHHGSREVWERIEKGTLLAEVMRDLGYQSFGVSANSAAGSKQGLHKGFDEFIDYSEVKKRYKRADADRVSEWSIELLDEIDPDKPLFMWLHYVDPHWRYGPPSKRWPDQPKGPKCRNLQSLERKKVLTTGQVTVDYGGKAKVALEDCSALYDAEIAFTDAEIGRVIRRLEELGRWDDAIKVFTSDHGENLGEDDYYYNHGPSLNDASMKIPLIIAGPTIPHGRFDATITRIEDVVPTLFTLLNLAPEDWPQLDGVDLSWRWNRELDAPEQQVNVAVAEAGGALHLEAFQFLVSGRGDRKWCLNDPPYSLCYDHAGVPRGQRPEPKLFNHVDDPKLDTPLTEIPEDVHRRMLAATETWGPESTRARAVRNSEFKLVAYPQLEGGYRYALYDLVKDPGETTNVYEQKKREAAKLLELLQRWQADLPLYQPRERTAQELDELRSLGYIQ